MLKTKDLMNLTARQQEMRERMISERLRECRIRGHQSVGRTVDEAIEIIDPPAPEPIERTYRKGSVFYIINVLPRDGTRYKFGYTSKIENCMRQHRIVAPDCILVRTYKCHPLNEDIVLRYVRRIPGVLMQSREVGDITDSRQLVETINNLFRTRDMTCIQ